MKTQSKKKIDRLIRYFNLNKKIKAMAIEKEILREEIMADIKATGEISGGGYSAFITKEMCQRIQRKLLASKISQKIMNEVSVNEERIKLYVKKG